MSQDPNRIFVCWAEHRMSAVIPSRGRTLATLGRRGTVVTSWNCPKCGRWHDLKSCDETLALARFAQLLSLATESDEASRAADEDLRRYLGRTRRDRPAA
jgi:hypothetical protein